MCGRESCLILHHPLQILPPFPVRAKCRPSRGQRAPPASSQKTTAFCSSNSNNNNSSSNNSSSNSNRLKGGNSMAISSSPGLVRCLHFLSCNLCKLSPFLQVQQGFEHPGLLQLQQQFHHQQQMQHQLMLGAGHANLAPLVGQQISQLSSLVSINQSSCPLLNLQNSYWLAGHWSASSIIVMS